MTYATKAELLAETTRAERHHFMKCGTCDKYFDLRSFDDVMFHCAGHKERPDFNMHPGVRIAKPSKPIA